MNLRMGFILILLELCCLFLFLSLKEIFIYSPCLCPCFICLCLCPSLFLCFCFLTQIFLTSKHLLSQIFPIYFSYFSFQIQIIHIISQKYTLSHCSSSSIKTSINHSMIIYHCSKKSINSPYNTTPFLLLSNLFNNDIISCILSFIPQFVRYFFIYW